jgi:hypothetical protein
VDPADADATRRWLLADARGFHDATPSDESLAVQAKDVDGDRVTAAALTRTQSRQATRWRRPTTRLDSPRAVKTPSN